MKNCLKFQYYTPDEKRLLALVVSLVLYHCPTALDATKEVLDVSYTSTASLQCLGKFIHPWCRRELGALGLKTTLFHLFFWGAPGQSKSPSLGLQ